MLTSWSVVQPSRARQHNVTLPCDPWLARSFSTRADPSTRTTHNGPVAAAEPDLRGAKPLTPTPLHRLEIALAGVIRSESYRKARVQV